MGILFLFPLARKYGKLGLYSKQWSKVGRQHSGESGGIEAQGEGEGGSKLVWLQITDTYNYIKVKTKKENFNFQVLDNKLLKGQELSWLLRSIPARPCRLLVALLFS